MDFSGIEKKWEEKWEKEGIFRTEPDKRKKFFITVPYPYPSGGMHVGHVRTYTIPDIIARFKRMQGYNVLFPMAWHVTGTPIIGAVKRLKEREKKQMFILKEVFRVSEKDLKKMDSPMRFADYFIENHYKPGMKGMGFGIDWRRQFTTNDANYSKFIEWQYLGLKRHGLVSKGLHPVKYCLNCGNPVTTHDILEGEGADVNEFVLVKFKFEGKVIPMATLRPETIYGVTNVWVNPDSDLVEAKVGKENWIVSKEAMEKLGLQGKKSVVIREFRGRELLKKKVKNPVTGGEIPILPATFVDPDHASGIVMSVPAHAPFDYIALKDLGSKIKPVSVIRTKGLGEAPAVDLIEKQKIVNQREAEKIESLTKEVYKREFHQGVFMVGKYKGRKVSEMKDLLIKDFRNKGVFDVMHEFSEKVKCRCGGKVVIAKKGSWFLDYKNKRWKVLAEKCLNDMKLVPKAAKREYIQTIHWLESWPCVRNFGLGTQLPWDRKFMIEPLSDSTIYMAYYTIAHLIRDYKPDQLKPALFDYIFLGRGSLSSVGKSTKIKQAEIKKMRKSFNYWYPMDFRCSAVELLQNHLTFSIFHHARLFPREKWPRGFATWGMGLLEGGKMSSSKGNVVLASDAVKKYGADAVRLFLFSSVEPWQDFDWRDAELKNAKERIVKFYKKLENISDKGKKEGVIDKWMVSEKNRIIKDATSALERFETRKASLEVFRMGELLKWYERRGGDNAKVLADFVRDWVKLLAPFIPHICEEVWDRMGNKGLVSGSAWPSGGKVDERLSKGEGVIRETAEDIKEIVKIVGKKPESVNVYVSPGWKHTVYNTILSGVKDSSKLIPTLMKDPEIRKHGKGVVKFAERVVKEGKGESILSEEQEYQALKEAVKFFSKEIGCEVKVLRALESKSEKASRAEPGKPGIEIF
jgi:leucyl-tRNA synthetase